MSRPHSNGLGLAFDAADVSAPKPRGVGRPRTTAESFWAQVDRGAGDDRCWIWTGRVDADGYGSVSWAGKDVRAHRLAVALTHGPIPAGGVVLHACDCRLCCNPRHLSVGTIAANNADMIAKGRNRAPVRQQQGAANTNAKLTDDLVRELRAAWRAGETMKSIVRRTGLSQGTVHPMLHGKTWRHVQ